MNARELRALLKWADTATRTAQFWRRLWLAADAYDLRTKCHIRALVAEHGIPSKEGACNANHNRDKPI